MCLRLPRAQRDRGGGWGHGGVWCVSHRGCTLFCVAMAHMQWCGHAFRCGATRWCGVRRVEGLTLHLPLRRLVIVPLRMRHVCHISDCAHRTLFPVCAVYTNSPRATPIAQPVPALLSPSAAPSLCTSYLLCSATGSECLRHFDVPPLLRLLQCCARVGRRGCPVNADGHISNGARIDETGPTSVQKLERPIPLLLACC